MHPPSRARRILKWTGAGLALAILGVWIVSLWYVLPGRCFGDSINKGCVFVGTVTYDDKHFSSSRALELAFNFSPTNRFGLVRPDYYQVHIGDGASVFLSIIVVPLWLPFLLTAIPTAWLWHRDRRRIRPGHCARCGYDLTGNLSGICSECGQPHAAGELTGESRK